MSDGYGFSDVECKIILAQIERRAKMRKEFLRLRSDPCQNSLESGHVPPMTMWCLYFSTKIKELIKPYITFQFDPAVQRFMSMKVSQLEFFRPTASSIKFAMFAIILPMTTYGYLIWSQRTKLEREIRCGRIKYRDRLFKFK